MAEQERYVTRFYDEGNDSTLTFYITDGKMSGAEIEKEIDRLEWETGSVVFYERMTVIEFNRREGERDDKEMVNPLLN